MGPDTLSQIKNDVIAENSLDAKSTDSEDFAAEVLDATSPESFGLALQACGGLTTSDSNRNKVTIRLNDFRDENIKNTFIKLWILIGKGLNEKDDAYKIWKKVKDDMKDDSILQHKEVCKLLEPTFDAIDRVVAMSLLLVIKNYKSTTYATEIADGGSGHDTQHRRLLFYQSLQASLVRSTTTMVIQLSAPGQLDTGSGDDELPPHAVPTRPTRSHSAPS